MLDLMNYTYIKVDDSLIDNLINKESYEELINSMINEYLYINKNVLFIDNKDKDNEKIILINTSYINKVNKVRYIINLYISFSINNIERNKFKEINNILIKDKINVNIYEPKYKIPFFINKEFNFDIKVELNLSDININTYGYNICKKYIDLININKSDELKLIKSGKYIFYYIEEFSYINKVNRILSIENLNLIKSNYKMYNNSSYSNTEYEFYKYSYKYDKFETYKNIIYNLYNHYLDPILISIINDHINNMIYYFENEIYKYDNKSYKPITFKDISYLDVINDSYNTLSRIKYAGNVLFSLSGDNKDKNIFIDFIELYVTNNDNYIYDILIDLNSYVKNNY